MTICHKRKFIWFRVAKVATRTILNHLKESDVFLDVEHPFQLHYPVNAYDNYFKFAFVRNPWDRLASCWRDKVIKQNHFQFAQSELEKMKSFKNFVNYVYDQDVGNCDVHIRSQSELIDLNKIDYLGRIETFNKDAGVIFHKLGLPEKEISRWNVTSQKMPYQEYYDEQLAEKVSHIYQRDIQIFGYHY